MRCQKIDGGLPEAEVFTQLKMTLITSHAIVGQFIRFNFHERDSYHGDTEFVRISNISRMSASESASGWVVSFMFLNKTQSLTIECPTEMIAKQIVSDIYSHKD